MPEQIEQLSMDLSPAFIAGAIESFPNASITFDRFHVIKLLNEAMTKQPPAKAGGFELRTESPATRRLNDASYSGSILKLSFGFGSK